MRPGDASLLHRKLAAGHFVVTAEIGPPKGTDVDPSLALASALAPRVDAFNVTDNQNARLRLSPLALCRLLIERGLEVIHQATCRDRNRLALQSDLLGAWALGIRNVLALTGDHITAGDHPDAAPVFDLDSIQLLSAISFLNGGRDLSGKPLKGSPSFFAGAALAPSQEPRELALLRFRKKISAGARFFQTQAVFGAEPLAPFREVARGEGVYLVAGVLLLHSPRVVEYIDRNVPGLRIPPETGRRIRHAKDPLEAGLDEACRIIGECREACHGVHLMTAGRDDLLPGLIERLASDTSPLPAGE
jgi:methylenetetrahydrofolate reductase (NADPH)